MFGDSRSPVTEEKLRKICHRSGAMPVAGGNHAEDTIVAQLGREAVGRRLKRVARVDILRVNPGLAALPVHVVAEQHRVQNLSHIWLVGKQNMAAVVEDEAVLFEGLTEPADAFGFLQEQILVL